METYRVTITVGGVEPNPHNPTTTLILTVNDWVEMVGGRVNPQQAFMQGRIRLTGDMNLPMGLLSVVVSP